MFLQIVFIKFFNFMLCLVYSISEESGEEMVSPVSAFIKSMCTVVYVLASEYMVHRTEHIKGYWQEGFILQAVPKMMQCLCLKDVSFQGILKAVRCC